MSVLQQSTTNKNNDNVEDDADADADHDHTESIWNGRVFGKMVANEEGA